MVKLVNLQEEFQKTHDLPLLIRNLLVYLDSNSSARQQIKKATDISLYRTTNKDLPHYGWWDFNEIVGVLVKLTGYEKSVCSVELRRCLTENAKSPAEIHVKSFYLGRQAKVRNRYMIRTNSPIDKLTGTGKRVFFKRCERTHNIILCNTNKED